jgi:hypothetical protein
MTDEARAEEFVRRQVLLLWAAALVVLVTLTGVSLALFLLPATSYAWAINATVAGACLVAVLFAVLLRHAVRLAGFAFRKELS